MLIDPAKLKALAAAQEHDPFAVLGRHRYATGWVVRTLQPHASSVTLLGETGEVAMRCLSSDSGVFEWRGTHPPDELYRLRVDEAGHSREGYDCWAFPPQADHDAMYLFAEGRNFQAYRLLGAVPKRRAGVDGVCFRTWAPNAARVSVVGDFNHWDGRCHPMASLGASGAWELFIPELEAGSHYRFEIVNRHTGALLLKSDPYGREFENRPGNASRIPAPTHHVWGDGAWMEARAGHDWLRAPMSVYEVHLGSWKRHTDGRHYTYRELADSLIPYVLDMGFTHIELMPVTEHPLDESWGYQTTGYFAPTRRHGSPDDLRAFIDRCHQAGIGVLLDWVPAHFPSDAWALEHYDGTALYEHEAPQMKMHPDWGTHVFNYGRHEVRSFLLSSAHYWLDEFHIDGLRVDAVASMLYLDYSRKPGEWIPNRYGGRENLEALDLLRQLNIMVHERFPGAVTIAEESTAWPMVSRPVHLGGLGFSMKWNMGWMNDSLRYFATDPLFRSHNHELLTFGQVYAHSENFVLPLSHDEVVHGKGALPAKMPGDAWQRMANLRLLLAWQAVTPGRKLLFMGCEFGQTREWSEQGELDWALLAHPPHAGLQRMVRDLNHLHREVRALHELDFHPEGFDWIDCHDHTNSVVALLRRDNAGQSVIVVLNFTPVPRHAYRIGAPLAGTWHERFNSDSAHYGGSDLGNAGGVKARAEPFGGWPASMELTLPPLAALILQVPED